MATQTYVTDLQAMNPTTLLNVQQKTQPGGQTIHSQGQKPQTTTIIQPSQAHTTQQFIVTNQQLNEQNHGQDTVTLQQGGQTVYPTHVQYVDSNDPALYASTNGQMYDYYSKVLATCSDVVCAALVELIV